MRAEIRISLAAWLGSLSLACAGNVDVVNVRDAGDPSCAITVHHSGKGTKVEVAPGSSCGGFSVGEGKVTVDAKTAHDKASTSWDSARMPRVVVVGGHGAALTVASWEGIAKGDQHLNVQAINVSDEEIVALFGDKEYKLAPSQPVRCGGFGSRGVTVKVGAKALLSIRREEACGVTVLLWKDGTGAVRSFGVTHY